MTPCTWTRRFETARGSVSLLESLIRISGAKKSFQADRNANSPTVISPGLTAGSSTRQSAVQVEQPSTIAASSNSRGIASNEIRIMKVANGNWNIVSTSATPSSEFCSPSWLSRTYNGISNVAYGTIRIASVVRNSRFLPGNVNRANAYPPRNEISNVSTTVVSETNAEFA